MNNKLYIWFNRNDEKFYVHMPNGRDHGGFEDMLDVRIFLAKNGYQYSKVKLTMPLKRKLPARRLTCFGFHNHGK
jgi:hypothetical protein